MCERMIHRGPDSEGLFVTNGAALGMRRLAIIDLVTGEQPVFNEDKSVAAILNGELYNYRELRADLEKRGSLLRSGTRSDVDSLSLVIVLAKNHSTGVCLITPCFSLLSRRFCLPTPQ